MQDTPSPRSTPSNLLRLAGILLALGIMLYGAACAYLWAQQRSYIFLPKPNLIHTPLDFGANFDEVWLPARADKLHGWWLPAANESAPVLLYLHGNDGNIGRNAEHAARFHALGFSVLLFDYRGYGKSAGDFPSEQSVYQDAQAAWRYLIDNRKIDPKRIVIYGHSLGSAIAIDLAAKTPQAAGLIVESGFSSMIAVVQAQNRYPYFPTDLLLTQRFDSESKLKALRMPVLYVHGTADEIIPYQMSQILYRKTPTPKRLILVEDAGHDNVAAHNPLQFQRAISEFLKMINLTPSSVSPQNPKK